MCFVSVPAPQKVKSLCFLYFCFLLNCLPYLVNKDEYKTGHCLALENACPSLKSTRSYVPRFAGPRVLRHRQSMTYFQIQRDTGLWYSAEYSSFSVGSEADKYRLSVSGLVASSKFFHIPKGPLHYFTPYYIELTKF